MSDTNILLPFGYEPPDDADIREGKEYIIDREKAAAAVATLIAALLQDAAEQITRLCYQYQIDPSIFQLAMRYNEKLFDAVSGILDKLENDILDLVLEYSAQCTKNEEQRSLLIPWVLALGRDNRNLRQTLDTRLWKFSRDLEAMIVAMMLAKHNVTRAVMRIKSNLKSVYVMPEMKAAFKKAQNVKAAYIRSKGVKYGNTGSSNSEANNIERFGMMTVQMAWMHNQLIDFKEEGAGGFVQLRGSNYPCQICDDATGFYPNIDDMLSMPYPHFHCQCYRVPIFKST